MEQLSQVLQGSGHPLWLPCPSDPPSPARSPSVPSLPVLLAEGCGRPRWHLCRVNKSGAALGPVICTEWSIFLGSRAGSARSVGRGRLGLPGLGMHGVGGGQTPP